MRTLNGLAAPQILREKMIAMAALDLILCPEDWLRYHLFYPEWSAHVSLGKVDNGSGDHMFVAFTPDGCIVKGFDHESALSPHAGDTYEVWPGIYEDAPAALLAYLDDEAIEKDDVTFCIWREAGDTAWRKGEVHIPEGESDGSSFLLGTIYENAEDYVEWAEDYFDMPVEVEVVREIYKGSAITEQMILSLNAERNVEDALRELGDWAGRIGK
ncbi:hypothetical protein [Paenibacillus eucommiae]|uniref:Uncharacterized protein n=1 Tax=Paenibacillus eucommiae TaxID=1355755 RepID=A0ABS4JAX7_9BACL|nr:hypothetical protein [Paenibacillus eucommiae]MBP1996385.1 hypothetical protein [Paenibacillus eucommiae]